MFIISTGGTFNKIYNKISGKLEVDSSNKALEKIEKKWFTTLNYTSLINKDSLDFTNKDREELANYIKNLDYSKIIVIHGTDTIDLSAKEVASLNLNKAVVFTGAMVPFSISKLEATANFALAYGYLLNATSGVYIALNGVVDRFDRVIKNREKGKFERK
ncbi:MAG: asparaginase [Epsilonproteobacteria bacterium]|nr:asparaginase [Campylobacterota bacterium]